MEELLEMYSSENLFPREQEGPRKGKLIPWKDIRGNVVVDPTASIKQAPFIIDYRAYNKYKALHGSSGIPLNKNIKMTREEKEEIDELFKRRIEHKDNKETHSEAISNYIKR